MNWKERRGTMYGEGELFSWQIISKRNGKFFVKAYRSGGAEVDLPWLEFESVDEAKAYVQKEEADRQSYGSPGQAIAL